MSDARLRWGLLLVALLAMGCDAKCREVEPLSKVEERTLESFEERLDEVDASDAQRAEIRAIIKRTMPKLAQMRERTLPRQREIIAELKAPKPSREKLASLIGKNIDEGNAYMHALVDAMMEAHPIFSAEQRAELARNASEPSDAFEGSWLLDRAVDLFLSRIDATAEQRALVERMKVDLITRGRALQKQGDALRREAAQEYAKAAPDAAKIHATLDRGRDLTRTALYDLAGYYLLLASKLEPRQRQVLNAEMVRFEPCPTGDPAGGARTARATAPRL